MNCKYNLKEIASNFQIEGEIVDYGVCGKGHINDTYVVTFTSGQKYTIQRINHVVFTDVKKLMNNIVLVTEFIKTEYEKQGLDPSRRVLQFCKTKDGVSYTNNSGNFFRAYRYIDDVTVIEQVIKLEDFYECGVAFGKFQRYLRAFTANQLFESIPDFHNTRARFNALIKAFKEDVVNKAGTVTAEIEYFKSQEKYVDKILDLLSSGDIPLKVTHNDTKINNMLLDNKTRKGICIIDLDTIMPGSILYDFGDAIRTGCSSLAEDDSIIDDMKFNSELFETYAKGFLSQVGEYLVEAEIKNLAFSGFLMTLECGLRFLTDYLKGDVYFKVKYPDHNLVRARNQIRFAQIIFENLDKMQVLVESILDDIKK